MAFFKQWVWDADFPTFPVILFGKGERERREGRRTEMLPTYTIIF